MPPWWILGVTVHWGSFWHLKDVLFICLDPGLKCDHWFKTITQLWTWTSLATVSRWWKPGEPFFSSFSFTGSKQPSQKVGDWTDFYDSLGLAWVDPSCCWNWDRCQSCACSLDSPIGREKLERSCAALTWSTRTCATCPRFAMSPSTPARLSSKYYHTTTSRLDTALTPNRHQSSILGDVHGHRRLHVFDADLDLLIVTRRVKILFIDLVQIDKLSLQSKNNNRDFFNLALLVTCSSLTRTSAVDPSHGSVRNSSAATV